ncbi:bacterioferritin [Fluviispira multicolorata]|uniref:Bacterioferritin n=1 Tax=Fluviispira multicolorata TaxID=2654512 RepID=A0A833JFQ4_9BACT|nr:bacterioferritin [Fluviispira multicolorata]KAB8033528.1 bacterioferritin [Fluviispira multicolorata]
MKGDVQVIKALNEVLTGELTAINQYFLHARMCKNWGYNRIAEFTYKESIEEMKHAQSLLDRILFLEGVPNLQKLDKLNIGENVKEQFEADLALEFMALERLKKGIDACEAARDHTSCELLEHILEEEENHIDWLEAQLGLIKDIGLENYLAQQLHEKNS